MEITENNKKEKLEDLSDYDKALFFYDGKNYNMALYFFNKYKSINYPIEESLKRINEFITQCDKNIEEINKKYKQQKETSYIKELKEEIQKIISNENPNDLFKINDSSIVIELLNSYKKLIPQFHPDVNDSSNLIDAFNKISLTYNKILSKKSNTKNIINPFELFIDIFKDININNLLSDEKLKYEAKKNGYKEPEGIFKYMPLIQIFLILGVLFNFIVLKLNKKDNMISFEKSDVNPFERVTHRHKVKYYVNNEFKEKYIAGKNIKEIEKIIEENYLEYLQRSCDEGIKKKEKISKRLIYYRNNSKQYKDIIDDINKINLSFCETYK